MNYSPTQITERTQELLQKEAKDISSDQAESTIQQLISVLRYHNRRYYIDAQPVIADVQYDALFALLQHLEEEYPQFLDANSPTQQLQVPLLDKFVQADHTAPLLSLSNSYNADDIKERGAQLVRNFNDDPVLFNFLVEPKFDGASVELIYESGRFVQAITRGDGIRGEDITAHIRLLPSVPQILTGPLAQAEKISLRGEVVMPHSAFVELNNYQKEEHLPLFANPRNATAGSLRQLDPNKSRQRGLVVFVYDLLYCSGGVSLPDNDHELLIMLREAGCTIYDWYTLVDSVDALVSVCEDQSVYQNLLKSNIEMDGLVIKLNELALRSQLGTTAHHPRRAIAYKYPAQQVVTTLEDVHYQIGRTGVITPVAQLTPVDLGGAMISRATLHNFDQIQELDIRKGDKIWIQRSGEVIPYVIGPLKDQRTGNEKPIIVPECCPSCSTRLVRNEGEVAWICPNTNCEAKLVQQLQHFVSKQCLDIIGLGDSIIELLVEQHIVRTIVDLFLLGEPQTVVKMQSLPGLGTKKITQILEQLEIAKTKPMWRWLHGLGIPGVGKKTAQDLEKFIAEYVSDNTFEAILSILQDQDLLVSMYGLGELSSVEIARFFFDSDILQQLNELQQLGMKWVLTQGVSTQGVLANTNIVITGSFAFGRDGLTELLQNHGATVNSAVSSKTDFLIVGTNPGSKLEKAKKLGVSVYTREDFEKKYPTVSNQLTTTNQQMTVEKSLFDI